MSNSQTRCLVTGATGYIGGQLVPVLLERGHPVRALARNPDKLNDAPWRARVEVARGDLGDPDSLTAAFTDVDVVYYLVHSMGTSSDFVAEEARAAQHVVTAAQQAGVKRIVYLSGLHPDGEFADRRQFPPRRAPARRRGLLDGNVARDRAGLFSRRLVQSVLRLARHLHALGRAGSRSRGHRLVHHKRAAAHATRTCAAKGYGRDTRPQ